MRHRFALTTVFGALALSWACGALAQARFTDTDWPAHRANMHRAGGNNSDQPVTPLKSRVWVWPPTADMPAEMVVDNGEPPSPFALPANTTGQSFTVGGSWAYPAAADRGGGAWPTSAAENTEKAGDYVFADAVTSTVLSNIGLDILENLPNLGSDLTEPDTGANRYARIHQELAAQTTFARWSFGTQYPANTLQGTRVVGNTNLGPAQRYAVYIRFPSSSTTVGTDVRPNVDHVMVRVSWGADPNNPATSRIFMLNFGETGGYWKRVRTGAGDDRYFPYDGTNPITVTLYAVTPDDVSDRTQFGAAPVVTADAVRLVPEAARGDIRAPASSVIVPPGAARYPAGASQNVQLTYFGREETTGPPVITDVTTAANYVIGAFRAIPYNPALPVQADPDEDNFNPLVADASSSIRSAVFYCIEDDIGTAADGTPDFANSRYSKLRWRYVAQAPLGEPAIIDDAQAAPYFAATAGFLPVADPAGTAQSYLNGYHAGTAAVGGVESARWRTALAGARLGGTYSVFVWIPGGTNSTNFSPAAEYRIETETGTHVVVLDQRNTTGSSAGSTTYAGTWRLLANGVRFPSGNFNGNPAAAVADVTVTNNLPTGSPHGGTTVVADAIQFVPEGYAASGVQAAPLVANVGFGSETRTVVYFATTDGRLWAMDGLGTGTGNLMTSALWVYPSISNPERGAGNYRGVRDDPNFNDDPQNQNKPIDGDLETTEVDGDDIYTVVNKVPDLGAFLSSPLYVEVVRQVEPPPAPPVRIPLIVVGNQNGRIYAFDPAGRTFSGAPHPATITNGNVPGVPGTTRRLMTWPTTARDKWLDQGGTFSRYQDDPARGAFSASLTAPKNDDDHATDRVIAGAGDGHVYCVDLQTLDIRERISNPNNNGAFRWQYPGDATALDAITLPGALSANGSKYVFSAGGRVYAISNPNDQANGTAEARWTYPFTANPPGTTEASDVAALDTAFTAPVLRANVGAHAEVAFVANKDGRVFAIDSASVTDNGSAPTLLWQSQSFGTTRASAIYLQYLTAQATYSATPSGPAIILPLDTGAIIGYAALTGRVMWNYYDAFTGGVPMTTFNGTVQSVPNGAAWRGADATAANYWLYQGDEGNQDTGEMHGQMHAYANSAIGLVVPNEPDYQPDRRLADLRIVNLWDDPPFGDFGKTAAQNPRSPFHELANAKQPSTANFVIYEWGDAISVAAWGAVADDGNVVFPQVTFRLSGGTASRPPVTVAAVPDHAYTGPPLTVWDPLNQTEVPARPWVAKYRFELDRGSEADPQTPGTRYSVTAQAQVTQGGLIAQSGTLAAGQTITNTQGDPNDIAVSGTPRAMAIAHPLALTTRGALPGQDSTGQRNVIGWTNGIPANGPYNVQELLANGDRLVTVSDDTITPTTLKGLVAPMGLISHGATSTYLGVNGAGVPTQAFYVADRSNLWKRNHGPANVRVERRDLRWGWNSGDPNQQTTSNVMNPLPWEMFPYRDPASGALMPMNASFDYPDISRNRVTVTINGVDVGARGVTLAPASVDDRNAANPVKTLVPVPVTLRVDVPRFQPANVNRHYVDINGAANSGMPNGFLAPMVTTTGADPTSSSNQALYRLLSPSGGYTGNLSVFIDNNRDGRWTGSTVQDATQAQVVVQRAVSTREEVYRHLRVGLGVPPDVRMRTEEQTVDLGTVAHSEGYSPAFPFAPAGFGLYATGSPWMPGNGRRFFAPLTVRNTGNVNLVNVRLAKVVRRVTETGAASDTPVGLSSDQVEHLTNPQLLAPWVAPLGPPALGNIGVVSSFDHANAPGVRIDNMDLWPVPNPYVAASGTQPRPTLHKARAGDAGPTTLSVPDVPYGDPAGLLTGLDFSRPVVGIAVPLGTPVGTYAAPLRAYEDHTPAQWRDWLAAHYQLAGVPGGPTRVAVDDNGVLDIYHDLVARQDLPAEGFSDPAFTLKVTVREARLTNQVVPEVVANATTGIGPDGGAPNVDVRMLRASGIDASPGANIQPAAMRDPVSGNVMLYWATNRLFDPNAQPTGAAPWYLTFTRLNAVTNSARSFYDWSFANPNQWWNTLPAGPYPDPTRLAATFPSDTGSAGGLPVVPGTPVPNTVRHYSPAVARDPRVSNAQIQAWLFWQGTVLKNSGATADNATGNDTRTFYAPLNAAGTPIASASGLPYSFRNDPELPRFSPRPIILTESNGRTLSYLFWYGGPRGRTRLYYNYNAGSLTNTAAWSRDAQLTIPGSLTWVADPVPVHRRVFTDQFNPAGAFVDCIDLVYTTVVGSSGQAEAVLTRYALEYRTSGNDVIPTGRLIHMRLPAVDRELMVRDGNTQTWKSRDLAWVIRWPGTRRLVDSSGAPPYTLQVNGATVTTGTPTYDASTGRVHWNSALGGQLVINSQAGTVTFLGVAPRATDRVTISYVPQTMRMHASRGDSGAVVPPAGWAADPGYALLPHVMSTGSNTGATVFIDRSENPRRNSVVPAPAPNQAVPVTRMWLIYRKTNANTTAPAALYYKSLRLMVKLPRGVLRDIDQAGNYTIGNHVRITGNRGPVEVDWVRGRLYFTEVDEGNVVNVGFDYARNANGDVLTVPDATYRVAWRDETSTAVQPADQTTHEMVLPTDAAVNEGQVSAFKDPLADRVWVFWSSTRSGTTDLYYMTVSPPFYSAPSVP